MGQLVGSIKGMSEACKAFNCPVVSGNVSLYNETNNEAILPTPVIGCVGLIEDIEKSITLDFKATEETIFVIGKTYGWLGCSAYQKLFSNISDVQPPPVDLIKEKKNGEFVRFLIDNYLLTSCHDISDGGIGVALAEMSIAGGIGAIINTSENIPIHNWLFGEDQGRYIIASNDPNSIITFAEQYDIEIELIGKTVETTLTLPGDGPIPVSELKAAHERWLPEYMGTV